MANSISVGPLRLTSHQRSISEKAGFEGRGHVDSDSPRTIPRPGNSDRRRDKTGDYGEGLPQLRTVACFKAVAQ